MPSRVSSDETEAPPRYHPNGTKLWVWIHRSSQRTAAKAVTAETSVPTARGSPQSVGGPVG